MDPEEVALCSSVTGLGCREAGWQMTQTLEEPPPAPLLCQKEHNNGR